MLGGGEQMKPTRMVAMLLAMVALVLMAAQNSAKTAPDGPSKRAPRNDSQEVAGGKRAVESAAQVALIPVLLPLFGDADQKVMVSATQALQSMKSGNARGIMILEFRARDGKSIGNTGFERALSLARFLASDQFSRVRTVAYVPVSLSGHAVLPVLACEEIVINPDAQFGAAGRGTRTVDATMRTAYREIAQRRRTVPVPIVLSMLDPSLTVIETQLVGGGTRYVLSSELPALRKEVEVWKENTIVPAGNLATFSGREMRLKFGFASHLATDRKELANALQVAPEAIREDVVVQQAWRALQIDLRGRITPRSVDDVARMIRDAERKQRANLICLRINSPGGQAAPALRLVQILAGLDANTVRTVAFVEGEARSVAALVALAADETYAREDAVLGGPGDAVIDRGALEALRDPVESLATAKNRDWSLMLALVNSDLEVFRYRREGTGAIRYFSEEEHAAQQDPDQWRRLAPLDLAEGITGLEAKEFGLIADVADDVGAALQHFNIEDEITVAKRSSVVSTIERLATQAWFARTLLFIAFFALISEASAPGIGVAGFVSGLCFLLFFWCQFLNGTAG